MDSLETDHKLALILEQRLIDRYGTMLSSRALARELAYPSEQAYRQALMRGTMPIKTFTLPKRRGRYALTIDLARWIAVQYSERNNGEHPDASSDEQHDTSTAMALTSPAPAKETAMP